MLTDHERVLLDLKRVVASKSHHGQRELLAEIAHLEVLHAVEEGLPEQALRLYGVVFHSDLIRPSSPGPRVVPTDGHNGHPPGADSHNKEERHGRHHAAAAGT